MKVFSFSYDFFISYSIPLCSVCGNQVFKLEKNKNQKTKQNTLPYKNYPWDNSWIPEPGHLAMRSTKTYVLNNI